MDNKIIILEEGSFLGLLSEIHKLDTVQYSSLDSLLNELEKLLFDADISQDLLEQNINSDEKLELSYMKPLVDNKAITGDDISNREKVSLGASYNDLIINSIIDLSKAVITTPTDKGGKFEGEKVPTGASVWITVTNPESPLSGRHILITKRPDGLFAITGGGGVSPDDEVAARRHLVLTGTPRKTKRDLELEQEIDEAEEYNDPIIVARKEIESQAREEIRAAAEQMKSSLGLEKINKTELLKRKDEVQNYIESALGEEEKEQAKRLTDTVTRQIVIAEKEIRERVQKEREVAFVKVGKRLASFKDEGEISSALTEFSPIREGLNIPIPNAEDLIGLTPQEQEHTIAQFFDKQVDNYFDETRPDSTPVEEDRPQITLGETIKPLEIKSVEGVREAISHVQDYWSKRKTAEELRARLKRVPLVQVSPTTLADMKNSIEALNFTMTDDELESRVNQSYQKSLEDSSAMAFYDAVGEYWNNDTSLVERMQDKEAFKSTMKFHTDSGAAAALAALAKEYLDLRLDSLRLIEAGNVEIAAASIALEARKRFGSDPKGYDTLIERVKEYNSKNQNAAEQKALGQHNALKQQYNEIQRQKAGAELLDQVRISSLELNNLLAQRRNLGSALGSLQASATFYDQLVRFKMAKDDVISIKVGPNKEDAEALIKRLRLKKGYSIDPSDPDNLQVRVGLSSLDKFVGEEKDIKAKQDRFEKLKTDMSGASEDEEGRIIVDEYDVPFWKKTWTDERGVTQPYRWRVEQRNDINWLLEATKKDSDNPLGAGGGLITRTVGAGKTNTALGFFGNKLKEDPEYKGLITVPKGRAQQWYDEAKKFTDLPVELITEGVSRAKVEDLLLKSKPGTIYVTGHREAARAHQAITAMQIGFQDLKGFNGLVIDEPQELQARGQTGNIGELGKKLMRLPMQHRIGLTATPARKLPIEAYDLIKWTSGSKELGSRAMFQRVFSGFGGGTNAQDSIISKTFFKTIQPFISGDRLTTPNFKVVYNPENMTRTTGQISRQKEIEAGSAAYISRRKQEITDEVMKNPNHPLRRLENWQTVLPRRVVEIARREVEAQHQANMDGGDYKINGKLLSLKSSLEGTLNQKHVIYIDSRVQRNGVLSMLDDLGLKPTQIKNIAATTTDISAEEMSKRVKAFRTEKNIPIIFIDKVSSTGYNLQQGDVLHVVGTPVDAANFLQAQGRLARMPRIGDVEVKTYKYSDNPVEDSKWNELESQLKLLRATSPSMFVGQ